MSCGRRFNSQRNSLPSSTGAPSVGRCAPSSRVRLCSSHPRIITERCAASSEARNALNVFATEAQGFAPSFVGLLPLGPVELFARGGILWYDLEIARNDNSLADVSDRDSIFGAGIGFTIAERLNLRAEYEVVEIDGLDDPNAVWLTAAWRF